MATVDVEVHAGADRALARACDHLLSLQTPEGWWKGELETNVTMDAEDLLLREFLGIRDAASRPRARRAGSARSSAPTARWANFHGGPGDLSTTIEAYVGAAARRRRPGADAHAAAPPSSLARSGGARAGARVHPHLAGAVRRLAVGATCRRCRRR